MNNSDMPAMPQSLGSQTDGGIIDNEEYDASGCGLTKLEHFAGLAMQGAWWESTNGGTRYHYKYTAESCVAIAKALLEELEKQNEHS